MYIGTTTKSIEFKHIGLFFAINTMEFSGIARFENMHKIWLITKEKRVCSHGDRRTSGLTGGGKACIIFDVV